MCITIYLCFCRTCSLTIMFERQKCMNRTYTMRRHWNRWMIWLRCWPSFKMVGLFLFEIGFNQICLGIYRTRSVLWTKNYCNFCRFVIRFVKRCTLPWGKCNILQIIRIHTSTLIWARSIVTGKNMTPLRPSFLIIHHHDLTQLSISQKNLVKRIFQMIVEEPMRPWCTVLRWRLIRLKASCGVMTQWWLGTWSISFGSNLNKNGEPKSTTSNFTGLLF